MVTLSKHARALTRAWLHARGRAGLSAAFALACAVPFLVVTLPAGFCGVRSESAASCAPGVRLGARAAAQDGAGSDWESGPAESRCSPRCRSGYECRHSECVPICSPACGPGYLCTAGGACVRTDGPPPQSSNQGWGSGGQCLPSCRSGYTCVSGQCVSLCNPICPVGEYCTEHGECVTGTAPDAAPSSEPAPKSATTAAPAKEAAPERSSSADSIVNLHFDALGLLQFGLTPTLEVGKKFSGYLRVRPLNSGLLSYFLLADHGGYFQWGIGGALGMHIFSAGAGNMRGVFGGPAIEYVFVQTKNTGSEYRASYGTHALVPQLDLGYRWGFDSFLLGVGGRVGLSIPVAHFDNALSTFGSKINSPCVSSDPLQRKIACDEDRSLHFVAGIFVDLGVFL